MSRNSSVATIAGVAQLLGVVLVVGSLYNARDVLIPLSLAVLLSFLLSPFVNRLQRIGVGNVLAVLTTAALSFVVLACTLTLVGRELTALVSNVPQYKEELKSKAREFAGLSSGLGSQFEELAEEVSNAMNPADGNEKTGVDESSSEGSDLKNNLRSKGNPRTQEEKSTLSQFAARLFPSSPLPDEAIQDGQSSKTPIFVRSVSNERASVASWAETVGTILGPLGTVGLVTVFVLFLLVYREDMRDRLVKVISRGDYVTTTDALQEVSRRISRYLLAQTVVNVSYGAVFGLGLYAIGLFLAPSGEFPNVMLWGLLATIMRFVPYVGPIAAASLPLLVSVAVFPGYTVPLTVLSLIVVLELTSNNLIEPLLYGASTGISAIGVILAAVFWGWMWGPVGLLLSTPLTVCLVVLGKHVRRFGIFATLLGDESNIRPSLRLYQRLLSGDERRITSFLQQLVDDYGATETLDEALVPALKRIRADLEFDRLSNQEAVDLVSKVEQATKTTTWNSHAAAGVASEDDSACAAGNAGLLRVVGCAAHQASEELLLRVFALSQPSLDLTVISHNKLPDAIAEEAAALEPDAILVHVLPGGGFAQARYLCQGIRQQDYKGVVVVCCAGKFRYFDQLFVKFRKSGANYMTTSWTQTASKLQALKPKPKLAVSAS